MKYDKAYKMKRLRLYLRLINTKGMGAKKIKRLVNYVGSVEDFTLEKASEVLGKGLAEKISKALKTTWTQEDEVLELLKKHNIKAVTLEDANYPKGLKTIDEPPPILFYKGTLPEKGIGVVGTRNPSQISLQVVEKLIEEKRKDVISGGARGIDLKAHEEALKQGFKTFVILGSGILNTPPGVKNLLKRREESVSLISEFLPFQRADRYTFPRRNRIIAALSEEVYVIEAGKRSGALITASYALKYGKPLYVFVGERESERWEGGLELLRGGIAREYKPKPKAQEEKLIEFLKKPRTYDEVAVFLGIGKSDAIKLLTKYMIKGLIKKEGAYYMSL